jgi:hypothetical protein
MAKYIHLLIQEQLSLQAQKTPATQDGDSSETEG